MPASLSVGTFGKAGQASFAYLSEDAHVAGAYVLARLCGLDHHHVDVAAEQRRDALAAAGERYEGPARAGVLLQQLPHHVVAARDRAARLLELTGILLGRIDEIAESLVGRVGLYRDHGGLEHQAGDGRQVPERDLGLGAHERVGQPDAGEKTDRILIAFLFREVGGGDSRAAAGLVDHLHAHRQKILLLDHHGNRAREHVAAAARPGMHDDLDGSAWA